MADAQREGGRHSGWGGLASGLVVVLVGVGFLLRNLGVPLPFAGLHHWWALFIVLGAVPMLVQATESYRKDRRVSPAVLHSLLSAAAVLLVAAFFLLDLDWGVWWPLFVILGGVWAMAGTRRRAASP